MENPKTPTAKKPEIVDKYGFFTYERIPLYAFFVIMVICTALGVYINSLNDDTVAPDVKLSLTTTIGTVAFIAFAILAWLMLYKKQQNITLRYPSEFRYIMLIVTIIAISLAIGLQYIVESQDVAQTLGFSLGVLAVICGSFFIYFQSSGQRINKNQLLDTIKNIDNDEIDDYLVKRLDFKRGTPEYEQIRQAVLDKSPHWKSPKSTAGGSYGSGSGSSYGSGYGSGYGTGYGSGYGSAYGSAYPSYRSSYGPDYGSGRSYGSPDLGPSSTSAVPDMADMVEDEITQSFR